MACELPFPAERGELQRFRLQVALRRKATRDALDFAIAYGVLLSPRKDRNSHDQEFLVLRDSIVRKTQGDSDQPAAIAARERLRARGAIEDVEDVIDRLAADVAFPSPSRAANFLCGRAENGWLVWRLADGKQEISLSEAYDLDLAGRLELRYYEAPAQVVWIPR